MDSSSSARQQPRSHIKTIGFIAAISLLIVGQALMSGVYWLQIPASAYESLSAISCGIVPICEIRYPSYFAPALAILLIAGIVLVLVLRKAALHLTQDIDWTTTPTPPIMGRWRRRFYIFGGLALTASALALYSAFTSRIVYPDPLIWLAALLLWGMTFFCLDRIDQRGFVLPRGEIFRLAGYIMLILALGALYHLPLLQTWLVRALFVTVVTLILFGLWRSQRVSGIAALWGLIAVVGLAIYTYNLDSWRYSFIGDEYRFYTTVRNFMSHPGFRNVLDSYGVYQAQPVFATFVQSLTMRLYGTDIYSWRVSGALMVFLSAPAMFVLVRPLQSRGTAMFAVILYVSAHVLLSFSHVGYFALQILLGFTAMLAFAVLTLSHQSRLAMFLCAVCAAFAFYEYILAFPLIPLPLLLLGIRVLWPAPTLTLRERWRRVLPLVVIFVIGVAVTAFPRVVNRNWLIDAGFTTVFQSEVNGISNPILQQVIPNVVYTLGATLYFDLNTHYVSGAHLDPLSSMLMIAGVTGVIAILSKRRSALWLLLSFLATIGVVGGFVPYPYPPNTRAFLLVPFYAIFAALGAAYLWGTAREIGLRLSRTMVHAVAGCAALLLIMLNGYQSFTLSELHVRKTPIAKMIREFQTTSAQTHLYYISALPSDLNLLMVLVDYQIDVSRWNPVNNPVPLEALSEIQRRAQPPYRVLFMPDLENAQAWYDAARIVWPDRSLEEASADVAGDPLKVIDVPVPG
jgi:hypothetical protein